MHVGHATFFCYCMLHKRLQCSSVLFLPQCPQINNKCWPIALCVTKSLSWPEKQSHFFCGDSWGEWEAQWWRFVAQGVYTVLVTLVFEQVQCPESMNRNTFPCFHPDPEPYSPEPLLSHTHRESTPPNPWIKPFVPFRNRLKCWCSGTNRDRETDKKNKTNTRREMLLVSGGLQLVSLMPPAASCFMFSLWTYFTPFPAPPSFDLSHSCFISSPRSSHRSSSIYASHAPLTLCTHSSFRRLRITAAPPREVCENAQCGSPGVPTPGTECEKRALHLMPDWPNLLPDSWAFFIPNGAARARPEVMRKERGRHSNCIKVCRDSPPTNLSPPPPLNRFSVKRKSVPGQQEATSLQNNQKTVCTHIWITFNLSHESPYIGYNTLRCPQLHLFFNTLAAKKRKK